MKNQLIRKIFNAVALPLVFLAASLSPHAARAQSPNAMLAAREKSAQTCRMIDTLPRPSPKDSAAWAKKSSYHDNLLKNHPDKMVKMFWPNLRQRYQNEMKNPGIALAYKNWLSSLDTLKGKSLREQADAVNDIVNEAVRYTSDSVVYKSPNYWATPIETLISRRGDCEDFAILKYHALLHLGFPKNRIHLLIVGEANQDYLNHEVVRVDLSEPGEKPKYQILDINFPYFLTAENFQVKPYFVMNEKECRRATYADLNQTPPAPAKVELPAAANTDSTSTPPPCVVTVPGTAGFWPARLDSEIHVTSYRAQPPLRPRD